MISGSPPTKGRLLVATPPLEDENFDRTVIYVIEHLGDGAVGVVLNRPTGIPLQGAIDRWNMFEAQPGGLYEGGPVEVDALIGLGYAPNPPTDPSERIVPLSGNLVSVDLATDPVLAADEIVKIRIFRGYAGWSSHQLDDELGAGAWLVVDAETDDLFCDQPETLWRTVLRRQPGKLSWLAGAPDDLHLN